MKRVLTVDIEAPAQQVWTILADHFCDVADWASTVHRSWPMQPEQVPPDVQVAPEAPVPGRMVVTALGQLAEVLTAWSDAERSFTFVALGVPGIMARATDTTRVVVTGPTTCRVELHVEMQLRGVARALDPLLSWRAEHAFAPFLDDLAQHAQARAGALSVA